MGKPPQGEISFQPEDLLNDAKPGASCNGKMSRRSLWETLRGEVYVRSISVLARIVAALLLGCLTLFAGPLAYANEATSLTASGHVDGNYVVVTGSLTSANGPIANAEVLGEVGGEWFYVNTNASGEFEMHLELPAGSSEPYQVHMMFEGQEGLNSRELRLDVGGPTQPQVVELALDASLSAEKARPDSVVEVHGTVTAGDGNGVGNRKIDALFNGRIHEESTTFTDDSGSFTTFVAIPADEPEGEAQIEVTTPETEGYTSASLTLQVTVGERLSTSDSTETTTQTPSPTQSPASGAPTVEDSDDEAAVESLEADARPAYHSGPWDWFWAIVVIVGGTALLITFALIIRGMINKRSRDEDDAVLLGDDGLLDSRFGVDDDVEAAEPVAEATPRRVQPE